MVIQIQSLKLSYNKDVCLLEYVIPSKLPSASAIKIGRAGAVRDNELILLRYNRRIAR